MNEIALKQYKNYGYSKKILEESFQEIKDDLKNNEDEGKKIVECSGKTKKVFNNTFNRIDSISSNEEVINEMKDELFKKQ